MTRSWTAEVRITPREGILDPEGQTIGRALRNLGHEGVRRVRAGRLVRIDLRAGDAEEARAAVERMCEELIANPLIEDYAVRVRPADAGAEPAGAGAEPAGAGATEPRGEGA